MSRSECQPRDGTQRLAGSARLSALPLAALAGGSVGASLPTFHVKAADRARVAYMPGTAWPVTGSPPDSSWSLVLAPVLMPPETDFDTSTAIRLRSPSRSPPDASTCAFSSSLTTTVFSQRSMRRFDATPRRATPKGQQSFIFHAAAHRSRSPTYIHLALCARGTHTIFVFTGCSSRPKGPEPLSDGGPQDPGLIPGAAVRDEESRRGESHPPPLAEPDLSLSAHPAPIAQPSGRAPSRQCANRWGDRRAISASHAIARRSRRLSRLYFRQAHRIRCRLSPRRK